MEQKQNYAKGIFLTKKKSKNGKLFLELSIKSGDKYSKYLCFESDKVDKFGNQMYSILVKEELGAQKKEETDLPF
jgi:hypothetical protein